jgi:hypothetical protein
MKRLQFSKAKAWTMSAGLAGAVILVAGCAEPRTAYVPVYHTGPVYAAQQPYLPPAPAQPVGVIAQAPPTTYWQAPPPAAPPPAPPAAPPAAPPPQTVVVVPSAPPPPIVERIPAAPAPYYVWASGHWGWNGNWVWVSGRWMARPRPTAVWIGGRWTHHGHGWVWVGGGWR